jgi:hypothetical protein
VESGVKRGVEWQHGVKGEGQWRGAEWSAVWQRDAMLGGGRGHTKAAAKGCTAELQSCPTQTTTGATQGPTPHRVKLAWAVLDVGVLCPCRRWHWRWGGGPERPLPTLPLGKPRRASRTLGNTHGSCLGVTNIQFPSSTHACGTGVRERVGTTMAAAAATRAAAAGEIRSRSRSQYQQQEQKQTARTGSPHLFQ